MKWPLEAFKGKSIIFVGHGREGESFKEFIEEHGQIVDFRFIDKKDNPEYLRELENIDPSGTIVVKSAGVPSRLIKPHFTTPTNVFFSCVQALGATTVGVTGTKGKSTTVSMIADILQAAGKNTVLAGNIGVPMLSMLNHAAKDTIFVLELSSYQLQDVQVSPHIAVCISLYEDHTTWHGSPGAYHEAKHNIVRFSRSDDYFVYNPSFPELRSWAESAACQAIEINLDEPLPTGFSLPGQHNQHNALAARTVARILDIDDTTIDQALADFSPLPHRQQPFAEVKGVLYVDDAIASTPEAAIAAIQTFVHDLSTPVGCILLGGEDRDYDFTELATVLAHFKIPNLVLFPETGARIAAELPSEYQPNVLETQDMNEAVEWAAKNAHTGEAVLLSPASPSYNLWENFEAKGDSFQQAVNELGK